jgi:hypothetical protein
VIESLAIDLNTHFITWSRKCIHACCEIFVCAKCKFMESKSSQMKWSHRLFAQRKEVLTEFLSFVSDLLTNKNSYDDFTISLLFMWCHPMMNVDAKFTSWNLFGCVFAEACSFTFLPFSSNRNHRELSWILSCLTNVYTHALGSTFL